MGEVFYNLGQSEKAINYYKQALSISKEIGHRNNEGKYLVNLGIVYKKLEYIEKAKQCFQESIIIFEEIKSPMVHNSKKLLGQFMEALQS